jgi:hypothetical protein
MFNLGRGMFDLPSMTVIPFTSIPRLQTSPRSVSAARLLVIVGVAAILPRVGFLVHPFESDGGLYIYMGKCLASGQTIYRDFYETKLPGVPLFTAGLYRIFGDHWWPYVLLQTAMAMAAAGLLAKAAGRHLGLSAELPTLAFAMVFLNSSPTVYRGFQLETLQTCLACIGAHFGIEALKGRMRFSDAFLLGLFAGAAAMIKPTAGAVAGALVLAVIVRRQGMIRSALGAVLGGLVAPALVLLWTWRAGLLGEMPGLLREIALYGSQTPLVAEDWFKLVCIVVIGGFPFLTAWIFRRQRQHAPQAGRLTSFWVFTLTWFALECLGVFLQKRMYSYHLLPIAAPAALLFGGYCRNGRRPFAYVAALGPILVLSLALAWPDLRTLLTVGPKSLPESEYLRAHASPGDTVVGDGIERLLMETHLRCGTRYAHLFYFVNHDAAPLEFGQRFLDDLEKNQPKWAIFETNRQSRRLSQCKDLPMYSQRPLRQENFLKSCQEIDDYLAAHYTPVAQFNKVTIYRRRL